MYKAIGFDYGGVIVNSHPLISGFVEILGVPANELKTYYYQHNYLANVNNLSYEELWSQVATHFGKADKIDELIAFMHKQQTSVPDGSMLNLITTIRQSGFETGLLSNNTRANADKMRQQGLDKYFDAFIISGEIGYQKPDHEAFQALFTALKVKPEELIFIDDSPSSLTTSEELGYHPILFTSMAQLTEELTELGVI